MRIDYSIPRLQSMAQTLRRDVIDSIYRAGSGHPGGSLSLAEILSALYFHEMDVDPQNPAWEDRDRFVLSKGHGAPCYYAALSRRGYFDPALLQTLRKTGSSLQGHPDRKKTPGVDMSTGSLGQGISAACGMAYYGKKRGRPYRVYCVLGDGEMQEGQVWEAMMSAAHFGLNRLTVLLDNNDLQIDGNVRDVMNIHPIREKAEAFGWEVLETGGHDLAGLLQTLEAARRSEDRPTFILCRTVKGKGVSFMENQAAWHGGGLTEEQYRLAMSQLQKEGGGAL